MLAQTVSELRKHNKQEKKLTFDLHCLSTPTRSHQFFSWTCFIWLRTFEFFHVIVKLVFQWDLVGASSCGTLKSAQGCCSSMVQVGVTWHTNKIPIFFFLFLKCTKVEFSNMFSFGWDELGAHFYTHTGNVLTILVDFFTWNCNILLWPNQKGWKPKNLPKLSMLVWSSITVFF